MALRVLLADESSTIKKVMQLALSDFAVEVKSVPVGLDVLPVAKSYKPDIVFADVLLTKRNGYEVSIELKNDPETANIPVVLMWSGFMEIDESKVTESKADGRLEKPFDADHLRNLVNSLVKKTTTNPVSNFLNFPEMPDFEETPQESIPAIKEDVEGLDSIEAIPEISEDEAIHLDIPGEEFSSVPLTTPRGEDEMDEGGWAHQDLTKFKLNIPEVDANGDFASKFVIPQDEELSSAHIEVTGDFEEISFDEHGPDLAQPVKPTTKPASVPKAPPKAPPEDSLLGKVEKSVKDQMMETLSKGSAVKPTAPAPNAQGKTQSKMDLNPEMMEKILREEAREVIESVCWKVLPEIAERIVREEINKLMRETERSI